MDVMHPSAVVTVVGERERERERERGRKRKKEGG
jgi:hypothetical protein